MIKTKLKLKIFTSQKGFTLVEFTIYAVIVGAISVIMTGFLWNIILGNIKETSYQEVQQNARFALAKMTQEIKKATEIIGPTPAGATSTVISLRTTGFTTTFDVVGEKLRITQGSPPISYYLTSDQVIVTNLQFTNLSYPDTPGTVRVEMTVDHINPGARTEYEASVNLKSSITLVAGGAATPPPYVSQLCYRWRNDDGGE